MSRPEPRYSMGALFLVLCGGLGCEVPVEEKVSLYAQGDSLHGGPAAQQAAQALLNDLELREVRFDWIDTKSTLMETRCRLGIFLNSETDQADGYVTMPAQGATGNPVTCDDAHATALRKEMGDRWKQAILPYDSDVDAQRQQATFARDYAAVTRRLGIEADEWDVTNELDSCIQERIAELSVHLATVQDLACKAYRDPSVTDVNRVRDQLRSSLEDAKKKIEDSTRNPPVVPAAFWTAGGNITQGNEVMDLPYRKRMSVEDVVGIPITLLGGEQFFAKVVADVGNGYLRLINAESGNKVADDHADSSIPIFGDMDPEVSLTFTSSETKTYVLLISYLRGAANIQVTLDSDGQGELSEAERQDLNVMMERAELLVDLDGSQEPLVEFLRWENEGAHQACVQASLFENNAYARNRAVDDAFQECKSELEHRLMIRERVMEVTSEQEEQED